MWSRFIDGQALILWKQKLSDENIESIIDELNKNPKITTLGLSQCPLSDTACELIKGCNHINMLDVHDCEISDKGAVHLASMPLVKLEAGLNFIGKEAGKALAESKTLTYLDVSENGLTDQEAVLFLKNKTLKTLCITGNQEISIKNYGRLKAKFETDIEDSLADDSYRFFATKPVSPVGEKKDGVKLKP